MTQINPASDFSWRFLNCLISLGVTELVLCPGSRSQALALAAAELESLGKIRLHVRVDERSAAFTALGIALETGVPAPVLVTSGTAVANLLPAVLEAHHSGVPMLLLTADRPAELRGLGANQTTKQFGLFGEFVRTAWDVAVRETENSATVLITDSAQSVDFVASAETVAETALRLSTRPLSSGPIQLNLQFTEPLSGPHSPGPIASLADSPEPNQEGSAKLAGGVQAELRSDFRARSDSEVEPRDLLNTPGVQLSSESYEQLPEQIRQLFVSQNKILELQADDSTVILAGHRANPELEALAIKLGAPLLAEATSSLRYGRNLIINYRKLLQNPELVSQISRVIISGLPNLSREATALLRTLQLGGARQIVLESATAEVFNPVNAQQEIVTEITVPTPVISDSEWLLSWIRADRKLQAAKESESLAIPAPDLELKQQSGFKAQAEFAAKELAAIRKKITRSSLVAAVWRASWPHDRLVVAASRLARVLDTTVSGKKIRVYSNRGLSGIDGTIATTFGVALASQGKAQTGTTRLLIGDLAFLHDISSLFLPEAEPSPRIQIIVGNDNGGTIFDQLEVFDSAEKSNYDRVMLTPQNLSLEKLASAYNLEYHQVTGIGELDQLLSTPSRGVTIIEVPLDR